MLQKSNSSKPKKHQDKNDLGENFIAPDGGYGWLVCIAGGICNFCIFPGVQVFGLIFRDKLLQLGFSNSQITTIINSQHATASGTGLLNGPMFRKLSYRQVGLLGALFVSVGLFLSSMMETFSTYIICYSLIFGFGSGIMVSATSLALNTYFKEKRRRAASFTWTITGLGPFIFPHIVTIILPYYGFQGTVWLFTGIALHSFACALIYQPVLWHTEKQIVDNDLGKTEENIICSYCQLVNSKNSSIFASQYIYTDDNEERPGYEIITPGTPMLSRVNDGWYGSKYSLSKLKNVSSFKDLQEKNILKNEILKPNHFRQEKESFKRTASSASLRGNRCTCDEEKKFRDKNLEILKSEELLKIEEREQNLRWYQKVAIFFDLDLLKDFTFVNLMIGMTLSTFADFNFTVLMPFFLSDFGFEKPQIALMMSLVGGADITVRFLVPYVVQNIQWDNRIFFIIAVAGMTIGRIAIAHNPSYELSVFLFLWIGAFKGLRTIFLALIIPSHVSLKRLPGASGLQLLSSGLFTVSCGPIVGIIRDATNYTLTLHFLNMISSTTVIAWTTELLYRTYKKKKEEKEDTKVEN